jgi:hypothetical protein
MLYKKNNFYSDLAIAFITVCSLCITFFFINWKPANHPFVMDVNQYYSYLVAVFIDHDLSFATNPQGFWLMETPTHQVVPKVTYGISFFYSPFFLFAYIFSRSHSTGYETIYAWSIHYGCIIYVLIGFFYVRKILKLWFNDFGVAISLFLIFFATNLFYYTVSESETVHGILFFLISFFLYHVIKWQQTSSRKSFLLFMLAAGFICLIRPTECLVFLFPALIGINNGSTLVTKIKAVTSLKWFLLMGIGLFMLPIIPQLIYWKLHAGIFLFFSYGSSEGFFWNDPQILNVLFSFKKGWFVYTPIMLFSMMGFIFMYKKNKYLFYPVLLYFLMNTYLISSWWDWAYGGSFGMRAYVHCYSVLIIPFAYFIDEVIRIYKNSVIKTSLVYFMICISFIFCTLNILQSNLYKHHIIHWDGMTKEAYEFTFFKKQYSESDLTYLKTLIKPPDYEARRKGQRDE